jgi:hypothetical protein
MCGQNVVKIIIEHVASSSIKLMTCSDFGAPGSVLHQDIGMGCLATSE